MDKKQLVEMALQEKLRREKLRRAGPKHSWIDFAPNLQIRSGTQIVRFYPYPHQQLIHQIVERHYGTIILKSRQVGITEYFGSRYLYRAIHEPAFAAALFSKNQDDTNDIARRVRNMVANLANIKFGSDSLTYQEIVGGGRLYFRPGARGAGRGLPSIHEELFDEAAFIEDIEEIYAGAVFATEMVGADARIVLCSTPNERSGLFYEMLTNNNPPDFDLDETTRLVAEGKLFSNNLPGFYWFRDNAGWAKVFVHWLCHPVYGKDKDFVEKQKRQKKLSDRAANRDYNLSFLDSSTLLFPAELVKVALRGPESPVPAKAFHKYIIGIDPNQGKSDYFAAVVIDVTRFPYQVVNWIYNNNQAVNQNLDLVYQKIMAYPGAVVKVEVNAQSLFYEKLQERFPLKKIVPVNTTKKNKITNTDRILLLMEQHNIIFPNLEIFRLELANFGEQNQKRKALAGYHDDLIMATAVALDSEEAERSALEALDILVGDYATYF